MTKLAEVKNQISTKSLIGILIALAIIIIGLIIGIVSLHRIHTIEASEAESYEASKQTAVNSCNVILAEGRDYYTREYRDAISQFESVIDEINASQDAEFKDCLVGVELYYADQENDEKTNYYGEMIHNLTQNEETQNSEVENPEDPNGENPNGTTTKEILYCSDIPEEERKCREVIGI